MPLEGGEQGPGFAIPQPCGVVERGGDEARPVRAERSVIDPTLVPLQGSERGSGFAIPQPCGVVL
jgi:hypothetical protein